MKFCINCVHIGKEPTQVGPNQYAMRYVCNNPDYLNPVTGDPISAEFVRKDKEFCTINGKGFIQASRSDEVVIEKSEEPTIIVET